MNGQQKFSYYKRIEELKECFGFDFVALALVQTAEQRFEHKWEYVVGNTSSRYKRIVLHKGKGIAGNVFKSGKPVLVTDVHKSLGEDNLFNYPIILAENLTSFGAIPLYKYNVVKGVLLVAFRGEKLVTEELFRKFKEEVGTTFGPFYNKEMVKP